MSVEAYEVLDANGKRHGAVLICSVTGLSLPVAHDRFEGLDEANAFLDWLRTFGRDGIDPRVMTQEQLLAALVAFQESDCDPDEQTQ